LYDRDNAIGREGKQHVREWIALNFVPLKDILLEGKDVGDNLRQNGFGLHPLQVNTRGDHVGTEGGSSGNDQSLLEDQCQNTKDQTCFQSVN
jgi:hypothetical protein